MPDNRDPLSPSSLPALPSPIVIEFLVQWQCDRESGRERSLKDYLELFPRHQELVAAEYLQLVGADLRPHETTGHSQPDSDPLLPVAQRYARQELLGEGGMGQVYSAHDGQLQRLVALKYSRGEPTSIVNEAIVAGGLQHPNIPAVHDVGVDSKGHFYVMDRIEGVDLQKILARSRDHSASWSRNRILSTFGQACLAMSYAHSRGVVHLDLKPANIMTGEFGELYIVDWGLSSSGESPQKGIQGTPGYMSPEQARGDTALDARSDMFSLGAILYEIITGCRAFVGKTVAQTLQRVREGRRSDPESWHAAPEDLRQTCEAMLQVSPQRRPTAGEVASAIQKFLEGTAEKKRRQRAAREALEQARQLLRHAKELERQQRSLSRRVSRERPEPWESVTHKRPHWKLELQLQLVSSELRRALDDAMLRLIESNRGAPELEPARMLLAQRYWVEFEAAEQRRDSFAQRFYEQQLRQLPTPEFSNLLAGLGSLRVSCTPAAQDLQIRPIVDRDRMLQTGKALDVPTHSRTITELPMGSWMVTVERKGYRPLSAPVFLSRGESLELDWRFRKESEIETGFVQIPAGAMTLGGDDTTVGALPRQRVSVKEFCIAKFPVSVEEYLQFIADLMRTSPQRARARAPRLAAGGALYDWIDPNTLTLQKHRGSWKHKRWPVFGVSWHDAIAYVRWKSARDGRRYALPSDAEWEKAARGTDARLFPWGNHYDAGFCKNLKSRKTRSQPEPMGAFKRDRSPYGVRDMAGGMKVWCRTWFSKEDNQRLVRGGSWNHTSVGAHCCYRNGCPPHAVYPFIGLRLVHHCQKC